MTDRDAPTAAAHPGREAESPTAIPARGWWQVLRRAWAEAKTDNVPILAGGVAFAAFLALFPALIAALTLYGLLADPAQVAGQIEGLASALPETARPIITDQLTAVTASGSGALGVGLVVSVLAALWSASGGTMNLIRATNLAYDEDESRGFLRLRGTALLLTLGAVVFVLLAVALVAIVPALLDALGLGGVGLVAAQVVRWAVLLALVVAALAVIYRVAPDRDAPRFRWVSVGAVTATLLWMLGSVVFSLYVDNFGSYNKTYGALAGVIVLMLWLYLTSYIVLLGAEINAESERQTERDTTRGEPVPLGERRATAADTVADESQEDREQKS
ncbi:YihY/virulence factor BrkB family protein [Pseudonocardia ailaonensis]|uniref:YihY/virulence factor BrkB family protein n=1 Tax=Pseudonocardia ailaonensis TaxID=367279 RepID=A0ABN2NQ29_9PSEU